MGVLYWTRSSRTSSLIMNFFLVLTLFVFGANCDPATICQPTNDFYYIEDTKQCDLFYLCDEKGEQSGFLCEDGLVFDPRTRRCGLPFDIDCTGRDQLQEAQPIGNCKRQNGKWAVPNTCDKYIECSEGVEKTVTCTDFLVYDTVKGDCNHPDIASRAGCTAEELYGFSCPAGVRHGRFAAEADCRAFFTCGVTNDYHPRLGGCPLNTVFNPDKEICTDPEEVAGCENYYKE